MSDALQHLAANGYNRNHIKHAVLTMIAANYGREEWSILQRALEADIFTEIAQILGMPPNLGLVLAE